MGLRTLEPLAVGDGTDHAAVLRALDDALHGRGPAWLPVPASRPEEAELLRRSQRAGEPIDERIALVVATSGTTGTPKGAILSADALVASGTATAAFLGGHGQWLLALPAHHIAGLQVLARSLLAGTDPVTLDVSAGFDPAAVPAAVAAMTAPRRYCSLVPTQLIKALPHRGAREALASLDAVLLGGAALPEPVRERAEAAGIAVVRTYGMSETAGGCVYDGTPLDGVRIRIDTEIPSGATPSEAPGRVVLAGPMLADGYRNAPEHPSFAEPGWFRTNDLGTVERGRLRILGRLDEAISTGGLTVVPQVVEAALAEYPGVAEAAVFALPDERLGQAVTAAVVAAPGASPDPAGVRAFVTERLGATAAPRATFVVDALPKLASGKLDRAALTTRFS